MALNGAQHSRQRCRLEGCKDARRYPTHPKHTLNPVLKPVTDGAPQRPAAPGTRQNEGHGRRLTAAFEATTPAGVEALAARANTFDFFERIPGWDAAPERFRLHAVATQRAADRLAKEAKYEDRDELLVSALLHDVGKLVLTHAYPGY